MTKRFFSNLGSCVVALGWLGLSLAVNAQPIQPDVLWTFPLGPHDVNGNLAEDSSGNFYGTTIWGGDFGYGTIFKAATDGTLTTLVSFPDTDYPAGGLTLGPDGNFYGITYPGNAGLYGNVFRMTPSGAFTNLVSFPGIDPLFNGYAPVAALTLGNDGSFYGTTLSGGSSSLGSVFRVTTDGTFTTLVSFDGANGAKPTAALTLGKDGNFYGTTFYGSSSGSGTVFQVTPSGSLTTLASFSAADGWRPGAVTQGTDGNWYGATYGGGDSNGGTVFRVTPDGTLSTLISFDRTTGISPSDLALGDDGNFYGTTASAGGTSNQGQGTVFQLTTNGTLTTLVSFAGTDGRQPTGALTLGNDGNFYGTTGVGGSFLEGTLFRMKADGTLTTIVMFPGPDSSANPAAPLTVGSDGNFYGTTFAPFTVFRMETNGTVTTLAGFNNGTNDTGYCYAALTLGTDGNLYGTTDAAVFRLTTNGALTMLAWFSGPNGWGCQAALRLGIDGNFYGTTASGGNNGGGTVFRMTPDGSLTTLFSFDATGNLGYTNATGSVPVAALALGGDGNFYGTTAWGGNFGFGTVFKVTPNGTLTTLVSFNGTNGACPSAALTLGGDGAFYGTTTYGGIRFAGLGTGLGTAFRVTASGALTTLASFPGGSLANPRADLVPGSDGNLYGTSYGENNGVFTWGSVFRLATNGTLTTLFSFNGNGNGWGPNGITLGADGNFYGTTRNGGKNSNGVIYRVKHGAYIQSFGMATNGFGLNVLNVGGSGSVVLQSSTDLLTWTPIQTNGPPAAEEFLDPSARVRPFQFYRALQQ
jgi:uncharacterized repeat protein (TIGR03803 family)